MCTTGLERVMGEEFKGCPTTRCYPRSLDEAFPNSVERAEWFYPPEKQKLTVVELLMWSASVSMWIGLAYLFAKN